MIRVQMQKLKARVFSLPLLAIRIGINLPGARVVAGLLGRRFDWFRLLSVAVAGKYEKGCTYHHYVKTQAVLLAESRDLYREEIRHFQRQPLISVVIPVYNAPPLALVRCLNSVTNQIYEKWQLCIVDDASTDPEIKRYLNQFVLQHPKARVCFRDTNGHISAATNAGIGMATGDYIAFLDHDDELTEDALYHVAKRINETPDADILYTDQDKITEKNQRYAPFFKPDWSPAFFRGVMYLGHLLVARANLVREAGGCNSAFDGVQDYELALRMSEKAVRIEHIPRICYHWRASKGSVAAAPDAKPRIVELQQQAVQQHLDRLGVNGVATPINRSHRIRIVPTRNSRYGRISVLICTKDAGALISRCLDSLIKMTQYQGYEVLVADNGTTDPEALQALERYPLHCVTMAEPFHFAKFNNRLAAAAKGDYLLFLNNDTEVLEADWMERLLFHAAQPDVGAVGPLLLYPDGTVQHAGVILGPRGTADHVMRGFPCGIDGYHGSLACDREVSAVTAACLLVSREKFNSVGGFEVLFRHHYEDVDFCLKLRARGLRNIYAGGTRLVHHESKSRGKYYHYTDRVLLLDKWEEAIVAGDPYYNINFNPLRHDNSIWVEGMKR